MLDHSNKKELCWSDEKLTLSNLADPVFLVAFGLKIGHRKILANNPFL